MRTNTAISTSLSVLLCLACASPGVYDPDEGEVFGGKADGTVRTLEPDVAANGELEGADEEVVYSFRANAGARVHLEVTRTGSSRDLDTILTIFGPSSAAGRGDALASDDEAGYGQLSEIDGLTIEEEGDYVAVLSVDPDGATDFSSVKRYRILLELTGGSTGPVLSGDLPKSVHWVRNSAEYVAHARQAYAVATQRIMELDRNGELPSSWAVALDVDETILSNSTYRRERALGAGTTWFGWVARRESTLIPGAREFIQRVDTLGGTVALVTNRHISQCAHTAANLEAVGVSYDVLLCQDGEREKEGRWQSVEDGTAADGLAPATIVMWVGDNIHDFRGMDQHHRDDASNFDDFGSRFIVMPNPMSGSWSRNPQN